MSSLALLLDMNVPPSVVERLMGAGWRADHAQARGLANASDEEIIRHARSRGDVIVTHDLDFGRILAVEGATTPSIMVLRVRSNHPTDLAQRLLATLPRVEDALRAGSIIVIEDAAIRVRTLPVGG